MDEALLRQEQVELAVSVGEEMLRNGAEVYRVEDTVKRILIHYGFGSVNVFTVSNGIFVTVDERSERPISYMRSVPSWSVNLGRVAELNKLSRDICEDKHTVDTAGEQLTKIKNMIVIPQWLQVLGTAVGSAAFCFVFGGKLLDMLVAFVDGLALNCFLNYASKRNVSKFIKHILGSILVTILSVVAYHFISGILVDKVIIGSIMLLVPGVALTTSIRDFFNGDYLSGSIHLIDALLTAMCIAAGVGMAMKVFMVIGWM